MTLCHAFLETKEIVIALRC